MRLSPDLDLALQHARRASLLAWEAIRPFYRGEFDVYTKEGEGPATDADIAADRAILDFLQPLYPSDEFGYLTEETEKDEVRLLRDFCWIVDPIDGTREFIEGRHDFAVQVGLAGREEAGGPLVGLVGVLYLPMEGLIHSARKGAGAWMENADGSGRRRLRVSGETELSRARLVVTRQRFGRRLKDAMANLAVREVYRLGSLGVKAAEVAQGRADLYLNAAFKGCKEWDVCAPAVILEEAGGRVTDLYGEPVTYNRKDFYVHHGLLASNGVLHDAALEGIAPLLPA